MMRIQANRALTLLEECKLVCWKTVPQYMLKTKCRNSTVQQVIPLLGNTQQECIPQGCVGRNVHGDTICNSPKLETTQMSSTVKWKSKYIEHYIATKMNDLCQAIQMILRCSCINSVMLRIKINEMTLCHSKQIAVSVWGR